ncbi:MAG: Fic family protein [Candidatus Saganbacteria bacterium]|nr:Fic family protein [Candidatus Saganbacteria bacterium]
MFKPNYKLGDKLLQNISQIERTYGQLEGLRLPQALQLNLERDNLLYSSYASNSIEGNPLSLPEVTNLLLDDRVPVNRDEQEVKNHFDILKNLETQADKKISVELVLAFHRRLMSKVDNDIAGKIRNKEVVVGKYVREKGKLSIDIKHNPPFHKQTEIKQALSSLIKWYQKGENLPPAIKIGIFHHQFVFIHPFVDGNGRACRLLSALLFLKNGYLINKYFVMDDYYDLDRFQYSDKLHSADAGNLTEWLEYFTDGIKYSLQSALAKSKQAIGKVSVAKRLTNKEQEAFKLLQENKEITSADLGRILQVSRQQSHNLLRALVNKGYAEKKGGTKASYYKIL